MAQQRPRAAIVGAGVAGLQVARSLRARAGFDVVIFERAPGVGGVWRENYAGFGAQVSREQYRFPELDDGWGDMDWYPTGKQLQAHCWAFVDKFGLSSSLRLGHEVVRLQPLGGGKWRVTSRRAQDREAREEKHEDFDLVVLAVGNFSTKFVPEVPGADAFGGACLHSSELVDATVLDGKHVAVVGAGKSALDCFIVSSRRAKSSTLIARSPTWVLPQRFCGLPLQWLAATRWFAALVFPPYYTAGFLRRLLGCLLLPLQWLLWHALGPLLWLHFLLPRPMRPSVDLRWQLWHGHSVAICNAAELRAAVRRPGASCVRGVCAEFGREGLVVEDRLAGRPAALRADVVVFATGFREAWSGLLDEATRRRLDPRGEGPELYRQILPADDVPGLAFVGRALSTSDIVTSFVQAEWLAHIVAGRVECPSPVVRRAVVERHRAWRRQFLPTTPSTFIATPLLHAYLDELLLDLRAAGHAPSAEASGPGVCAWPYRLWRWLQPHRAAHYEVFRQRRPAKAPPAESSSWVAGYAAAGRGASAEAA